MPKQITGNYSYELYQSAEELNSSDEDLLIAAKKALINAHAPYSVSYTHLTLPTKRIV